MYGINGSPINTHPINGPSAAEAIKNAIELSSMMPRSAWEEWKEFIDEHVNEPFLQSIRTFLDWLHQATSVDVPANAFDYLNQVIEVVQRLL